ncbi:MFS transporter [Elioraea rosea]|uniref:MFS transporter n=1 Tax=Elioraea rosea TaxID=2492390 RepID=UPI001182557F|nr:MFS transporter [Elioraea rosea]
MTKRGSLTPLLGGAAGLHAADQLALAAIPLAALLAFGGDARLVGLLVAAQALAWLALSLPAGLAVDRFGRGGVLRAAAALSVFGLAGAASGIASGAAGLLAAGVFVGSAGTVLFVLAAASAVPDIAAPGTLPRANARLELARALATLAAPPIAGLLAARGEVALAFGLASAFALLALASLRRVPDLPAPSGGGGAWNALGEGVRFLLGEPLLRGIAACALCWNAGFFALLAAFVPFALGPLGLGAAEAGLAQGGYGAGLLLGALAAPMAITRLGANAVLVAGPALSVASPLLLLLAPHAAAPLAAALAAQFLIGFGPMMWLICQQSIRQAVTPRALLGRVGAALQVAIYGVRPLGAIAGGTISALHGPEYGIGLAALLFLLSLGAVATSALRSLRRIPEAART